MLTLTAMKIYFVKYLFSIFHKILNTPAIDERQMMVKYKTGMGRKIIFRWFHILFQKCLRSTRNFAIAHKIFVFVFAHKTFQANAKFLGEMQHFCKRM